MSDFAAALKSYLQVRTDAGDAVATMLLNELNDLPPTKETSYGILTLGRNGLDVSEFDNEKARLIHMVENGNFWDDHIFFESFGNLADYYTMDVEAAKANLEDDWGITLKEIT